MPLNAYSRVLHASAELLWLARIVLIVSVVAHIGSALKLAAKNSSARPQRYQVKHDLATNYAARTMVWSGPILLGFILFHLAHLTLGVAPGSYEHSTTDVYSNVVRGFQIPWVGLLHDLDAGARLSPVPRHLEHVSVARLNHSTYNAKLMRAGLGITVIVTLGNIAHSVVGAVGHRALTRVGS